MNNSLPATLYIITAPSGAGKTSLVNALIDSVDNVVVSISYTTRPKRPNERTDLAYHFVDQQMFDSMIQQDVFLEHATVFSHYYGTSKHWVEEKLQQGIDVILEIDWQGAQQVRKKIPNSISIFIAPPSRAVLLDRLQKRAQDEETVIEKRMAQLKNEMSHYHEFDYLVINDDFTKALQDLRTIIMAQRLICAKQQAKYSSILKDLLL